ncbi:MAG: hypothetical protein PHD43_12380 [Methylococcales bacterium]|nr:hypothetical protein [Methylococcales bacterium]
MEPLKKGAITNLPDDAGMEEIMYRLFVLENIRRGQEDAEKGKTTPAEQELRDIQSLILISGGDSQTAGFADRRNSERAEGVPASTNNMPIINTTSDQ